MMAAERHISANSQEAESELSVDEVTIRFGGIVALDKVSFDIKRGEILGLIGPNGAGKTTLFNCISRLYTPTSGDVRFRGKSTLSMADHQIAALGIGRTFQNVALFKELSVRNNIRIGVHARSSGDILSDALRLPWVRRHEQDINTDTDEIIDYLRLGDVADQIVSGLPFGTQKRVELARALAIKPSLLLLDEPAGGLNHDEVHELAELIKQIRDDRDMTVLLVEHHMAMVMSISDRVVVLNFGAKIAEGTPAEVQRDPDVIAAYLGGGDE